jgi:hypothetical protein
LPAAPDPVVVAGPDGAEHRMRLRLWRTPGGISAEASELFPDGHGGDADDGFQLKVFGEHDADPLALLAELDERVRAEVGRQYLDRDRGCWQVTGLEVAGRVSGSGSGHGSGPPDVVIDGRRLSWDELGQAVAAFEGWWFRVSFGDDVTTPAADPGPSGVVVPLRPPDRSSRPAR